MELGLFPTLSSPHRITALYLSLPLSQQITQHRFPKYSVIVIYVQPPPTLATFLCKFCLFSPSLPFIDITSSCNSLLCCCQFWKERIILRDSFVIWCLTGISYLSLNLHHVWNNLLFQSSYEYSGIGATRMPSSPPPKF